MSQRKEKYARKMEQQAGSLEHRVRTIEDRLSSYGSRLFQLEADLENTHAMHDSEVEARRQGKLREAKENRRQRREVERVLNRQWVGLLIALMLAVTALIVAFYAAGAGRKAEVILSVAAMADDSNPATLESGIAGRRNEPNKSIASYEDLFREATECWGCTVNAWAME